MQIIRLAEAQKEKLCDVGQTGNPAAKGFGVAVDIGTTTVAMALYDLGEGVFLGSRQEKNRQTIMGADVMMRLMHCQCGRQPRLQELIRKQLEEMAEELCENVCQQEELKRMVVVGNTTMCHIFLGQDTTGLAGSPFQPSYQGAFCCTGEAVGFVSFPRLEICVVAGVDAHVGADAVAVAAHLHMRNMAGVRLAVDIGTNAELVLSHQGGLITCSAPAGPAFEGAEISQGMRGEPGAISAVRLAPGTGNVILDVIGRWEQGELKRVTPRGICGSGLIDAVAGLRQYGLMAPDGYLLTSREAQERGVPAFLWERLTEEGFLLYQAESGEAVMLRREDIRQFQLAKAAVQAGIRLLLASQELELGQVDQIMIAGVFGGHISKSNAVRTGLFPDVPAGRLQVVGNAAGAGAAQVLLSEEFRRETECIAEQAEHLELAEQEEFRREFLAAMDIMPWKQ